MIAVGVQSECVQRVLVAFHVGVPGVHVLKLQNVESGCDMVTVHISHSHNGAELQEEWTYPVHDGDLLYFAFPSFEYRVDEVQMVLPFHSLLLET